MLLLEDLGRTLHGTTEEETLYVSGDNLTQILGIVKRSSEKMGGRGEKSVGKSHGSQS